MIYNEKNIADLTELSGGAFGCDSTYEAQQFIKTLTLGHYENFPVGSLLIPKNLRHHVYAIYSFARVADDIADMNWAMSKEDRIELLERMDTNLDLKAGTEIRNPIFLTLFDTIRDLSLPLSPFHKLITAFKRDVLFSQPTEFDDVLDYCEHSANPVGELILRVFKEYDDEKIIYSNHICTALQLANFWQDLSLDIENGRIYIPKSMMRQYGIEQMNPDIYLNEIMNCLSDLYEKTEELFDQGEKLIPLLSNFRLKTEIRATLAGGRLILYKTRKLHSNIFKTRPRLNKTDLFKLIWKIIFG